MAYPDTNLKEQAILNRSYSDTDKALKTASPNTSLVVSYNAAREVVKLEKTLNGITRTKTFTRSDNVVASTLPISSWS